MPHPFIKLLTLGDSGAGKSSLLLRYTNNDFSEEFLATIGMDFKLKKYNIEGQQLKVQIWDTAGQERFRTITQNYYRSAHGVLLVYDATEKGAEEGVCKWHRDVYSLVKKGQRDAFVSVLVANKWDLLETPEEKVAFEQVKLYCHPTIVFIFAIARKSDEKCFCGIRSGTLSTAAKIG